MKEKILVDLDSLLDTRIALLNEIHPKALGHILPIYDKREHDIFSQYSEFIPEGVYEERHKNRTKAILKNSYRTGIPEFINTLLTRVKAGPVHTVEIDINIYPYELEPEEKYVIAESMGELLSCDVNVISVSLDFLPPMKLDEYMAVIMYNFTEWFGLHGTAVINGKPLDISAYYPRLSHSPGVFRDEEGEIITDEIEIKKLKKLDVFEATSIILGNFIQTRALTIDTFNVMPSWKT